mgnify:CR=1 FL=1
MKQAFALRECLFFDPVNDEYLGFCRNGTVYPVRPFDKTACRVEKGKRYFLGVEK